MGSHSTSTGSKNAMLRLSLRSVAAHKVRLALTILAVVLGTAFVSGSFMFTQSLSNTFDSAIDDQLANVDVVMSGEKAPMPRG
ncbi:ABC transporter permease, partial [Corynebacterium diphtheriae]